MALLNTVNFKCKNSLLLLQIINIACYVKAEIEAAGERGAGEGEAGAADAHDSDDDMADHYDAGNSPQHR